jgi:membrane-associated phospholipid phosphatase
MFKWRLVAESLARPNPVPLSMVFVGVLVPRYIKVPAWLPPRVRYVPELALDRVIPVVPAWAIVYGALYLFLILLPVFVVRQHAHLRRTMYAYLSVWLAAYAFFFVLYPTVAHRPVVASRGGFGAWGLKMLYSADPPYNCFPSLHVAHSFVSALACYGVHRRVGIVAGVCAVLVAVSTLLTKQHYIADVIAGIALSAFAYAVFLRRYPADAMPDVDRQAAPALAVCVAGLVVGAVAASWLAYVWGGRII